MYIYRKHADLDKNNITELTDLGGKKLCFATY